MNLLRDTGWWETMTQTKAISNQNILVWFLCFWSLWYHNMYYSLMSALTFLRKSHKFGEVVLHWYMQEYSGGVPVWYVWVGRGLDFLIYAEFWLCWGKQDLGIVEVAVVLGCKEIKAGDCKARNLELRSLPHGYLHSKVRGGCNFSSCLCELSF